jgi:tRNA threonylcarbamoyl adenosine modification protein YeaZ
MTNRLILVADTSTSAGSIAVLNNKKLLGEIFIDVDKTHSERVLYSVDWLLDTLNLKIEDIDLFISGLGPGSFTGIRIGLSLLKGFSLGLDRELVGVSTLDAIAMEFKDNGNFIAFIEGRANELFYALYEKNGVKIKKVSPYLSGKIDILYNYEKCIGIFKSEEIEKYALRAELFAHNFAYSFFEMRENVVFNNVVPIYVKKSDAEINLKKQEM